MTQDAGNGLAAVQARVAQLQSLLAPPRPAQPASGKAGATAFDGALADALGGAATTSSTGATAGADLRGKAVEIGKKYLGIPYRWGGTDPKTGLDCSGLTQLVYKQLGIDLPRVSRDQAKTGTAVPSLDQAKPGDLVFFDNPVDHVGIYVGDGKMLHAPRTGKDVTIQDVWEKPSHIRRVIPERTAGVAGAAGPWAAGAAAKTAPAGGTGGLAGTPYADLFVAAGRKHGVDPALLAAIAKAESSYNPRAVSHAGAKGLMQLMPGTARDLGVNPLDPSQAVDGAARLMSRHLRSFGGRVDLSLAAYNAGPGNVRKYGGIPPFEETRTYVQRVTRYWGDLR